MSADEFIQTAEAFSAEPFLTEGAYVTSVDIPGVALEAILRRDERLRRYRFVRLALGPGYVTHFDPEAKKMLKYLTLNQDDLPAETDEMNEALERFSVRLGVEASKTAYANERTSITLSDIGLAYRKITGSSQGYFDALREVYDPATHPDIHRWHGAI